MDMTGEQQIPAPRDLVWRGLNDPEILKQCIPGCEKLERTAPDQFEALVALKIGPIAARFTGRVSLQNVNPPQSYTLVGEGQGGVAGFGKGSADVSLMEENGQTRLSYQVKAQVGGKIAQLGARLIDATARKLAEDFFGRFNEVLSAQSAAATPPDAIIEEEVQQVGLLAQWLSPAIWVPAIILLMLGVTWLVLS